MYVRCGAAVPTFFCSGHLLHQSMILSQWGAQFNGQDDSHAAGGGGEFPFGCPLEAAQYGAVLDVARRRPRRFPHDEDLIISCFEPIFSIIYWQLLATEFLTHHHLL